MPTRVWWKTPDRLKTSSDVRQLAPEITHLPLWVIRLIAQFPDFTNFCRSLRQRSQKLHKHDFLLCSYKANIWVDVCTCQRCRRIQHWPISVLTHRCSVLLHSTGLHRRYFTEDAATKDPRIHWSYGLLNLAHFSRRVWPSRLQDLHHYWLSVHNKK